MNKNPFEPEFPFDLNTHESAILMRGIRLYIEDTIFLYNNGDETADYCLLRLWTANKTIKKMEIWASNDKVSNLVKVVKYCTQDIKDELKVLINIFNTLDTDEAAKRKLARKKLQIAKNKLMGKTTRPLDKKRKSK